MNKTTEEKFLTVVQSNTFYFFNPKFEEVYENHLNSIKTTLLVVKNKIENEGLKQEIFENLLQEKEHGLKALLALTGFSNEFLKRLTTMIRIVDDQELNQLVYKKEWICQNHTEDIQEWSDSTIQKLIQENEYFRKGIVNLFFEGSSIPFLVKTIPSFELKKLSISKLKFEIPEMIDTLIRYKEKGSYSGKKNNNPEMMIEEILKKHQIDYEQGDLHKLAKYTPDKKRTMDFIIPNQENPTVIIECSL